jgi:hypothetical protein
VDTLKRLIGTLLLTAAACVPDDNQNESLVDRARIIAVQMDPAEVAPRQRFKLRALYASGDVSEIESDVDWAFCGEQKPLSELGPIGKRCLAPLGEGLVEPFGTGLEVDATMPSDACRLFGPDRPPPKQGEPAGRPVDADPSGGYYQPVGLFDYTEQAASLYEARVACSLPGVTREQYVEWTMRYVRNVNPSIDAIEAVRDGEALMLEDDTDALHVSAGETLPLRAWAPQCGEDLDAAAACGGAEPYLYFDIGSRQLVTRDETLSAAWFATAGNFGESRTALDQSDDGALAENTWTAPRSTGPVTFWVVLRDSRGGVSWRRASLTVD